MLKSTLVKTSVDFPTCSKIFNGGYDLPLMVGLLAAGLNTAKTFLRIVSSPNAVVPRTTADISVLFFFFLVIFLTIVFNSGSRPPLLVLFNSFSGGIPFTSQKLQFYFYIYFIVCNSLFLLKQPFKAVL